MDPQPTLWQRLTSRKFLVAIVGAGIIAASELAGLSLDETTVASFAALLVAFILGEAKIDSDAVKANASKYVQALEEQLRQVIQANQVLASQLSGNEDSVSG